MLYQPLVETRLDDNLPTSISLANSTRTTGMVKGFFLSSSATSSYSVIYILKTIDFLKLLLTVGYVGYALLVLTLDWFLL